MLAGALLPAFSLGNSPSPSLSFPCLPFPMGREGWKGRGPGHGHAIARPVCLLNTCFNQPLYTMACILRRTAVSSHLVSLAAILFVNSMNRIVYFKSRTIPIDRVPPAIVRQSAYHSLLT